MRFVSTYRNLQVVLQVRKQLVDSNSGAVAFEQKPITIKFEQGMYETHDPVVIDMLLKKISDMTARGISPSFQAYPEDKQDIKEIQPRNNQEDQNQLLGLKDQIIEDKEKQIAEMAQQIEELSQLVEELKNQPVEPLKKKTKKGI